MKKKFNLFISEMADEDIEAYEAYLAEQAFQDQYAAEMEAMEEIESLNPRTDTNGRKLQNSENPKTTENNKTQDEFEFDDPFGDGDLLIDEPTESQKNAELENSEKYKRKRIESEEIENSPKRKKVSDFKRTRVLRVPPIECDSVRLQTDEGDIRYLRKLELEEFSFKPRDDGHVSLLGKSLSELRIEANKIREEQDMRKATLDSITTVFDGPRIEWTSTYR